MDFPSNLGDQHLVSREKNPSSNDSGLVYYQLSLVTGSISCWEAIGLLRVILLTLRPASLMHKSSKQ